MVLVVCSLVRNSVVLAVYLLFSVVCFFTVHEHCSAYLNEHYELTEEEIKEVMDGYDPSDKDNQSNLERMMQERAFSHLTE
ncbi:Uncharacterised protein [Roseburia hominis]|nr:Uncharacterised protein [Roseburia hominis]